MKHVTRKGFETWLRQHDPEVFVGQSYTAMRCPLANYTVRQRGSFRSDGGEGILLGEKVILHQGARRKLPSWALAFEEAVDKSGFLDITAMHALKLLAEVRP